METIHDVQRSVLDVKRATKVNSVSPKKLSKSVTNWHGLVKTRLMTCVVITIS
jgi:hypothetical protein